jgi:hypothetical protein
LGEAGLVSSVTLPPDGSTPRADVTISGRAVAPGAAPRVLNDFPIELAALFELGEIVAEAGMNHAIRLGCGSAHAIQILELSAMGFGACGDQRLCRCLGASEPEDLVAAAQQLSHHGGPDKTSGTCDKYLHDLSSSLDTVFECPMVFQAALSVLKSSSLSDREALAAFVEYP